MPKSTGQLPVRAPDRSHDARQVSNRPLVEPRAVTKALVMVGRRSAQFGMHSPVDSAGSPAELFPVGNRAVLFHVLDWLEAAGIRDVALAVDCGAEPRVREALAAAPSWSCEVRCLRLDDDWGFLSALVAAKDILGEDAFLLHLGDGLARPPLTDLAGGGLLGGSDAVLFVDGGPVAGPRGVADLASGRLASIIPGLPGTSAGGLTGVALFGPGTAETMRSLPTSADCELEMLTAAERLYGAGGRVEARVLNGWWRFRGQPHALLDANRFVLEGMPRQEFSGALHDSNIQGTVVIDDSAMIESTVIRGPAVVGARARLTDAYVGPYTSIGDDVIVEGAEIEHSIVLPGARISYLGGRLEASVIGSRARVFRDFKLPRAFRLYLGEDAEVSLA